MFLTEQGLHTENHGMVHNFMWDPLYPDQEFLIGGNEDQYNPHWWNDAEPFWVTAEKQVCVCVGVCVCVSVDVFWYSPHWWNDVDPFFVTAEKQVYVCVCVCLRMCVVQP